MSAGQSASEAVPRWARPFVAVLLVVLVVCALAGIEAWPFTGWELFSRLRPERVAAFEVTVVDASGVERLMPFDRLPYAYRGSVQILGGLETLSAAEQRAVCAAWKQAASEEIGPVTELRIYRTERSLDRRSGRSIPPERTLLRKCDT